MLKITIKFIVFFFLILIGYSIAIYLKDYNNIIYIQFLDYSIDINFLFGIGILLLSLLIFNILCRCLLIILSIPKKIINYKNSLFKTDPEKLILNYYVSLTRADSNISSEELIRALNIVPDQYKAHIHFIIVHYTKDFSQTITSLQYLISTEYKIFATKKLANIYLGIGKFKEALNLVETLPSSNDIELLLLMLNIYSKLRLYNKFSVIINKLDKLDKSSLAYHKDTIAYCYFNAAHDLINNNGSDNEAKSFLEAALLHKPDMLEAIELYCVVNVNLGQSQKNISLLENGFSNFPSFELFELYLRFTNDTNQEIYNNLCSLIDKSKNLNLLLSIAAYLKLFEEIEKLVANKLYIAYDTE